MAIMPLAVSWQMIETLFTRGRPRLPIMSGLRDGRETTQCLG